VPDTRFQYRRFRKIADANTREELDAFIAQYNLALRAIVPSGVSPVTSIFGRGGAVVALAADYAAFYVPLARTVNGYALSANVTLAASDVGAVPTARTITAGSGLTGGGDLSANRTLALTGSPLALFNLAAASGWLKNDGAGVLSYSTPTKSDVGLGNVDNTSDANKPISTATQTALDAKQPLDSDLTTIAGLTPSDDDVMQYKSGAWANRTIAQLKTDLDIVLGWELIGDHTVSGGAVSSITFSGLNGDVDEWYRFEVFCVGAVVSEMAIRPNNDSTANNYRYQYLQVTNATVAAGRGDYTNGLVVGNTNTIGDLMQAQGLLYAKSGQRRPCLVYGQSNINATSLDLFNWSTYWKDTATNITSLVFRSSGAGSPLNNGTRIKLWKAVAL
jgi:hypothetical protein